MKHLYIFKKVCTGELKALVRGKKYLVFGAQQVHFPGYEVSKNSWVVNEAKVSVNFHFPPTAQVYGHS